MNFMFHAAIRSDFSILSRSENEDPGTASYSFFIIFDLLFPLHLPGHPELLLPRSPLMPFPRAVPGNEDEQPESLEVNRWENIKHRPSLFIYRPIEWALPCVLVKNVS